MKKNKGIGLFRGCQETEGKLRLAQLCIAFALALFQVDLQARYCVWSSAQPREVEDNWIPTLQLGRLKPQSPTSEAACDF